MPLGHMINALIYLSQSDMHSTLVTIILLYTCINSYIEPKVVTVMFVTVMFLINDRNSKKPIEFQADSC